MSRKQLLLTIKVLDPLPFGLVYYCSPVFYHTSASGSPAPANLSSLLIISSRNTLYFFFYFSFLLHILFSLSQMALPILFSRLPYGLDKILLKNPFPLLYFQVHKVQPSDQNLAPQIGLPSMKEYMGQNFWALKDKDQTQDHSKFMVRITLVSFTNQQYYFYLFHLVF